MLSDIRMTISRVDIKKFVEKYVPYRRSGDEDFYWLAICYLRLGNNLEANQWFETSFLQMLRPPMFWKQIAAPDRLVNACILSARTDLIAAASRELVAYKTDKEKDIAYSPLACYAYALMELLNPSGEDISKYIGIAIHKPKFKEVYVAGKAVEAIMNEDQDAFNIALREVLKVYERQVKQGGLRLAGLPHRIMCMYAMSIAYVAHRYGLRTDVESEYFAPEYLEFLAQDRLI